MITRRKPVILNVDGNDAGRYAVTRALRQADVDVKAAASGTEALRLAAEGADLVILDINLPDFDGFEVCRQIKADPATSRIPVLSVTTEITRELDPSTLLGVIVQRAAELVEAGSGVVTLWEEADQILHPRAWFGLGDWIQKATIRPGEGITGAVAARRQGLIVNDYRSSPYAVPLFLERTGITATVAEPSCITTDSSAFSRSTTRPPGRPSVHRISRPSPFRRPGRHRHRERPAARRDPAGCRHPGGPGEGADRRAGRSPRGQGAIPGQHVP